MDTLDTGDRLAAGRTARSSRAAAALVAVLVLLIAGVVLAVSRPARTPGPATPQGAVRAYVTAVVDGDSLAAAARLAPGSPCGPTDLDRVRLGAGTQVDLTSAQVQGDRALVRVTVTADQGLSPLPVPGEQVTFRLVRDGPGWLLDGIPWPLSECTGG